MRLLTPGLSSALLASLAVAAAGAGNAGWNKPVEPLRVVGPVHFVGTNELAAFLEAVRRRSDPPVDGEQGRRAMALEAHGRRFVGPDNGLFSFIVAGQPSAAMHEISNAALFRREVSSTFHARDVFGPAAGHLACGASLDLLGPPLREPVLLPMALARALDDREWELTVVHVDRFGNLTTNLTQRQLAEILSTVGGDAARLVVIVEGTVLPLVRTYGDVAEGELCALLGSSARLEVAANRADAGRLLTARRGTRLSLRKL